MAVDDTEDEFGPHYLNGIGLSVVVDVFGQSRLFETLDNERVAELSRLCGTGGFNGADNVRRATGISRRRILAPGVMPADVAEALVRQLEHTAGIPLAEFKAILLCHSHTDSRRCEALASELAERIGLSPFAIEAYNFGCAGFLRLIEAGTRVLEGCDASSHVALLSVETPESWHDASDRLFCGIVSAGATAAVLTSGRGLLLNTSRAEDFMIPAERRPNPRPLFRKELSDVYTFRGEPSRRTVMRMNAEPVFLNGIELMLDNLRTAMLAIDLQPGQRVIAVPHQPSGKLLRALVAAARTEFPDIEYLNNLDLYGNTISCSIPTILARLPEVLVANDCLPLRNGDHVILLAAGICMTEINDHMTAGHACLRWQNEVLNQSIAAQHHSERLTHGALPVSSRGASPANDGHSTAIHPHGYSRSRSQRLKHDAVTFD